MSKLLAYHNSFDTRFRFPFGAATVSSVVRLCVFTANARGATLRLWTDDGEQLLEGTAISCSFNGVLGIMHTFTVKMPAKAGLLWYYFIIHTDEGEMFYSATHGEGAFVSYPPHSYRVTVCYPFETPQSFARGICYQIFPDRFRRGNVRGGLDRVVQHTNMGRRAYSHENWEDEVLYQPFGGSGEYDPCDFFGGDFCGIREALPYLKSLNVTHIYLNPVFESPSNHRYDVADYMHADAVLGGDDELLSLAHACDDVGIRLIFDGVFSHTGADSVYFNRYSRYAALGAYNSRESDYYSWYSFEEYPDKYKCWWGFLTLPEVDEDNESYRRFIASVILRWANAGVTSWRLDVADELTDGFMRFLRSQIKSCDSEGLILGEVWEDASNKYSKGGRRPYTDGDCLDGVMNYTLRAHLLDFFTLAASAGRCAFELNAQNENYPRAFALSCLNILSGHDTVRALSVLGGAPHRDALSSEQQAAFKLKPEQYSLALKRLMACVSLQMCAVGVPCIYYGDENAQEGMADPFCRRTFTWGRRNEELFNHMRSMTELRSSYEELQVGEAEYYAPCDDVLVCARYTSKLLCITAVNRAEAEADVLVSATDFLRVPKELFVGDFMNMMTGEVRKFEGEFELAFKGLCSVIFRKVVLE